MKIEDMVTFEVNGKRKEDPEKHCAYCGKLMSRVRFASGRLEDLGVFKRRKYCNRRCMSNAFDSAARVGTSWMAEHEEAREIAGLGVCEVCGASSNVDVHHKDMNWHNNDRSNLMHVCRSCHMKIHRQKKVA